RGTLMTALESARTGRLGDIVATIQGEQDEIIRAELPGVLVVQGGPGTGKTVVALHRAAYLLYTYRFPLEGQGVLVVGPNRLFLGYIEQVLPSLGEAGVELVVLPDLLTEPVRVRGNDHQATGRIKGDLRMAQVLAKAVRDRRRPLRDELRVGFGVETLRLTVAESASIVADARRRARTHNGGRRFVEQGVFDALARSSRRDDVTAGDVRDRLRHTIEVREALDWMWPVLTPAQLLHDLFGSKALLRSAAGDALSDEERDALYRPRSATVDDVVCTNDDVPLLDEARALLGPRPRRRARPAEDDEVRTYGHIVVDEAQDLSPMQLRMLARRSLNGSMTVVGDIAQATGAWAHADWDEIVALLPQKRPACRRRGRSVGTAKCPGSSPSTSQRSWTRWCASRRTSSTRSTPATSASSCPHRWPTPSPTGSNGPACPTARRRATVSTSASRSCRSGSSRAWSSMPASSSSPRSSSTRRRRDCEPATSRSRAPRSACRSCTRTRCPTR